MIGPRVYIPVIGGLRICLRNERKYLGARWNGFPFATLLSVCKGGDFCQVWFPGLEIIGIWSLVKWKPTQTQGENHAKSTENSQNIRRVDKSSRATSKDRIGLRTNSALGVSTHERKDGTNCRVPNMGLGNRSDKGGDHRGNLGQSAQGRKSTKPALQIFICGGEKKKTKKFNCVICLKNRMEERCGFPIDRSKNCDKPLCSECWREYAPELYVCPEHL